MLIQETFVNATKGHGIGETEPYEPGTEDIGELYKRLRSEYGACTGKVYIDLAGQKDPIAIGWVFRKRMTYEDARSPKDTYIREVWVSLLKSYEPQPAKIEYVNIEKRSK